MKWALVLSGGGGNGIAHIGVLKELERLDLKPSLIVGTSMGSVIGGVYASGKSADWIEDYMKNKFDIRDNVSLQTLKWGMGPVVKILQAGEAIGNLQKKRGVESATRILELLREITGNIDIANTAIPFACNAVDLISGKEKVFTEGNLAEAIRCSIAIPPFIEPYEIGNALYIDGGFADNLPVHIAAKLGFRRILSVDVVPFRTISKADMKNGYDVLFRAMTCTLKNIHHPAKATVAITAYKGAYNFDFDHVDDLVEAGRRAVINNGSRIKRKFS